MEGHLNWKVYMGHLGIFLCTEIAIYTYLLNTYVFNIVLRTVRVNIKVQLMELIIGRR